MAGYAIGSMTRWGFLRIKKTCRYLQVSLVKVLPFKLTAGFPLGRICDRILSTLDR